MRDSLRAVRVGAAVIVGVALAILLYRMINEGSGGEKSYGVYAHFDNVQGLAPKSRVVIAGIPVGQIEKISLDGERARVDMQIDNEVPLFKNATVAMRSVSLLGEKMLVIDPGGKKFDRMPPGSEIANVEEGTSTDKLMRKASDIADDVQKVTEQMARAFGTPEAGDQMGDSLKALNESLETINRTLQKNEAVINETLESVRIAATEGSPKLVEALENIRQTTKSVNDIIQRREGEIDSAVADVDDTVASIKRASHQLEAVLGDVKQVTGRTAQGQGTVGRLVTDDHLINEFEEAAESVNNLIGGLARLQTVVELRSEYNMLANTFKSYVSVRLGMREGRYFLIQLVDGPRGDVDIQQSTIRRSPALPGEPAEYQETRITRRDQVVFTFQLAKRIAFATLRFGFLESSGGIGLDLHFFDDRFEINADVFNFGYESIPRFRVRIAYEIVRSLWILGGVDDILNVGNADFFLGLQLRFNDDDLKSIIPFAGGAISG